MAPAHDFEIVATTLGPGRMDFNPNEVVSRFRCRVATPLGLFAFGHVSQGSSHAAPKSGVGGCLATLGFKPESLWDSPLEFPKGV